MRWWGWSEEGVSFTHEDKPALGAFLKRVLDELGNPGSWWIRGSTPALWVEGRRAIDSFFIRDVDRDKAVLYSRS